MGFGGLVESHSVKWTTATKKLSWDALMSIAAVKNDKIKINKKRYVCVLLQISNPNPRAIFKYSSGSKTLI